MSFQPGPSQWQRMQTLRDDTFQRARTGSADAALESGDRDEVVDERAALFRARYDALEKNVDRLFPTMRPCCWVEDSEFIFPEDDGDTANHSGHQPADSGNAAPAAPAPPTRRIIEDDYDDDDEDEDEEPVTTKARTSAAAVASKAPGLLDVPKTQQHHSEAKKTPAATREKLEADRKAAEESARKALSTMFFTLENDRDAMLEQQKLEESDRQVHAENNGGPDIAGVQGKLSSVNLGASSLTLKHLITRIDEKRAKVQLSDLELRSLISEVRKNRSKWASEDKIGQEELYEAAEKVTYELRAYTEHSTAFLNRVNRREVPDYFTVIKTPMDLGTVLKKLKQLAYKSKAEFVADLNLIWQNCFTYNGDPNHYLRKHAKAMQKKMHTLIPLIPDITIRDRAEVEAEEANAAEADADAESDDEPIMSTRGRKGPGTKKAKKSRASPTRAVESTPDVKPPTINLSRSDSVPPEGDNHNGHTQNGFSTPGPGAAGTPAPPGSGTSLAQMELDHAEKLEDTGDAEYQAWKSMTKKGRAQATSERHKLFQGDRLASDAPALLRSRDGLGKYIKKQARHFHQHEEQPAEDTSKLVEEGSADVIVPDYYEIMSAVPELPWQVEWRPDEEFDTQGDLRMGDKEAFKAPKTGLVNKMHTNMKQMQETRKVCSKISVIKQMQTQTQIYANQFSKYQPDEFVERDVDDFVRSEHGPLMSKTVCRGAMQRSIGQIFYHAGFEEFQPSAMEAVTDIAADYFSKLGRVMMLYKETPLGLSNEEIILHSMHEMGVDLDALEAYIKDDVFRLGTKLDVIHERMKSHLADLLRPALQDTVGDGSALFNDGSEQFVGGDFAEDIGDDFFGFKELGLDKEFGLDSLSVPLHLLQTRIRGPAEHQNSAATHSDGFKPPPSFEPLNKELIKSQIGIVQNFFLAKLHANNDEPLVEDEDLPVKQRAPKPRLPPTGKISMPRKRPQQMQGGSNKKKKKPNPPTDKENNPNAKENSSTSGGTPVKKGAVQMNRQMSKMSEADDGTANGGMISPESIAAGA